MPERPGERTVIFQDSDPEGHPARESLQRGIDALKLAGANVSLTAFSELGDANDILRHENGGEPELMRLIQTAAICPLSFACTAEQLTKLTPTEYEKARKRVAQQHGVRVAHLDREVEVALRRLKPAGGDDDTATDGYLEPEDLPWDGPIPELSHILDNAAAAMPRFLIAPKPYYDVIALWSAATYLVQSEQVALPIMPQLSFQSGGRKAASRPAWRSPPPFPIAAGCAAPTPRRRYSGGSPPSSRRCAWSICTPC
jgi:hypothetical protein